MKIQHISDVHCEFHSDKGFSFVRNLPIEGDILVIPGDFAQSDNIVSLLSELCERSLYLVFVPGNHEYYGTNRGTVNNKLAKVSNRYSNFYCLNNDSIVINGVRFLGTTLWWQYFNVSLTDLNVIQDQEYGLFDFRIIQGYKKWVGRENLKSIHFLQNTIEPGDIVITHHAPSWKSKVGERYGSTIRPIDYCYYNDLDDLIIEKNPAVWIHGHTHEYVDYMIGNTRVVSSPHGYAEEDSQLTGQCYLDRYSIFEI